MTTKDVKGTAQAKPFRPFTIHLADGQSVHVPHEDFISIHPRGRTVVVFGENNALKILDVLLVTELELAEGAA